MTQSNNRLERFKHRIEKILDEDLEETSSNQQPPPISSTPEYNHITNTIMLICILSLVIMFAQILFLPPKIQTELWVWLLGPTSLTTALLLCLPRLLTSIRHLKTLLHSRNP